jgi:3',5'-cyclic AMP phosphodiesterase CpdA
LALALDFLRGQQVEAIAMLGDLTNFGDEASIGRAVNVLAAAGVPVLVVPGNHDCEQGIAEFRTRVDRLGAPGVTTIAGAREVGGLRFVGLTDLTFDDDGWLLIPDVESTGWGGEPVVVLSHFPLLDRRAATEAAGWKYAGGFRDLGAARRLLDRDGAAIVLHGHLHVRDAATEGNVLQITCASLIEPPYEASVVEITPSGDGLRVSVEHVTMAESGAPLPVLTGTHATWMFDGAGWTAAIAV